MKRLLFLLIAGSASASPPDTLRAPAEVAPAVVKIGERVGVTLRIPVENGERLDGPPAPNSIEHADVLLSEQIPTGSDSSAWRLEVAFFETGERDLSFLPFTLVSPEGDRPVAMLPYVVSVVSVLPDSLKESPPEQAAASLKEIRGPIDLPARVLWTRVAIAALVLAALAAVAVWWLRRRQKAVPVGWSARAISPEEEALLALRALEKDALPRRGELKEHYARQSLILRHYVERRTKTPAVEFTTHEIQEALEKSRAFAESEASELLALLTDADLVKFAKQDPGTPAAEHALAASVRWIERAGARFQTPEPAPAGSAVPDTGSASTAGRES